ncbi:TlpA family protein disulfide reductase [Salinilacihabitans rarus]|uniref:TlpA family protein disulfide reductase n=1 Tax=Salinilacihabitans rarus TaxID=2961596 RepID=UPI0020C90AC0|nr:TlpA disulfide reductase family protein [Salinilacihabitans rarus]
MRRRELVAGLAGAGVLAAGGFVAARGVPSPESLGDEGGDEGDAESDDADEPLDPLEIETIDARGSEAGSVVVPAPDRPTFVDFFGTWCPPCIEQMPALAEAHERVGDEVLFLSVTTESVGRSITREELAAWWAEHDGNWTVGLDPNVDLAMQCELAGYPWAAAIDADGRLRWADGGIKTADELVAGIERATER